MSEINIKESLHTLHGTHSLMTYLCWNLEEKYSIKDMNKFQKSMTSTKGNFIQFLYDRDRFVEIVELFHGESFKDEEDNYNLIE